VWAVPLVIPGDTSYIRYSLSYLLLDHSGNVHVIDTGVPGEETWHQLVDALRSLGKTPSDVASVIVTHLHFDHLGLVERLRRASGASVVIHRREHEALGVMRDDSRRRADLLANMDAWHVPSDRVPEILKVADAPIEDAEFHADALVDDGELLAVPGRRLRVIHTPGHTFGSISIREETDRLLFTGDHVVPTLYPGLGLGGPSESNPLDDYLASLAKVEEYSDHEVLPGHGFRFLGLSDRTWQTARHHLRRTVEVDRALADDENASVWDVARSLPWTAGWERMTGYFLYSALFQTTMHMRLVTSGRFADLLTN
jgi:glyoxylase-like metal-dependent hydrolase (beta-lactamase superfamily II)